MNRLISDIIGIGLLLSAVAILLWTVWVIIFDYHRAQAALSDEAPRTSVITPAPDISDVQTAPPVLFDTPEGRTGVLVCHIGFVDK